MATTQDYADYRIKLLKNMTNELFGPERTDKENRQHELLEVSPLQLYSTGVLFPQKSTIEQLEDDITRETAEDPDGNSSLDMHADVVLEQGKNNTSDNTLLEEQPLNLANEFSPSAAGITIKVSPNIRLVIEVTAGRYKTEKVEQAHPKAGTEKADGILYPDKRIVRPLSQDPYPGSYI